MNFNDLTLIQQFHVLLIENNKGEYPKAGLGDLPHPKYYDYLKLPVIVETQSKKLKEIVFELYETDAVKQEVYTLRDLGASVDNTDNTQFPNIVEYNAYFKMIMRGNLRDVMTQGRFVVANTVGKHHAYDPMSNQFDKILKDVETLPDGYFDDWFVNFEIVRYLEEMLKTITMIYRTSPEVGPLTIYHNESPIHRVKTIGIKERIRKGQHRIEFGLGNLDKLNIRIYNPAGTIIESVYKDIAYHANKDVFYINTLHQLITLFETMKNKDKVAPHFRLLIKLYNSAVDFERVLRPQS